MGCDIHTYREKFINGQWQTADVWTQYDYGDDDKGQSVDHARRAYTGRNYELFGLLSKGVRREINGALPARGIPFDACPEFLAEVSRRDCDGHSHSYLYLHELKALKKWADSETITISGMMSASQLGRLNAEMSAPVPTYDSLYPYCEWSSDTTKVAFSVDIPMSYRLGDRLNEIIDSFNGIDGENHRLCFFFDN